MLKIYISLVLYNAVPNMPTKPSKKRGGWPFPECLFQSVSSVSYMFEWTHSKVSIFLWVMCQDPKENPSLLFDHIAILFALSDRRFILYFSVGCICSRFSP